MLAAVLLISALFGVSDQPHLLRSGVRIIATTNVSVGASGVGSTSGTAHPPVLGLVARVGDVISQRYVHPAAARLNAAIARPE